MINIISAIDGFKVGLIFVEQPKKRVKISWRALAPGINVSKIAQHFGGGGHAAAAGADVEGELEEIKKTVLKRSKEMLSL